MDVISVAFEAKFLPTDDRTHVNHYGNGFSVSTENPLNNPSSAPHNQVDLLTRSSPGCTLASLSLQYL